jgi:hypothetical protein
MIEGVDGLLYDKSRPPALLLLIMAWLINLLPGRRSRPQMRRHIGRCAPWQKLRALRSLRSCRSGISMDWPLTEPRVALQT